jgi:hypothetical protein
MNMLDHKPEGTEVNLIGGEEQEVMHVEDADILAG